MNIEEIVKNIGYELYFNCVLVDKNVRNAFLIQPVDYGDNFSTDKLTAFKINYIKYLFPNFILSDVRRETIVSKHAYENILADSDIGIILGYPCAEEYDTVIEVFREKETVAIDINVYLDSGDKINILSYVCLDDKHFKNAQKFALLTQKVLKQDPLMGFKIVEVKAEKDIRTPVSILIEKLISKTVLTDKDKEQINDTIYNDLFYENNTQLNQDYSNDAHVGMIITLLLLIKNDPTSPFWPLNLRPEHSEVKATIHAFQMSLIAAFAATSIKQISIESEKLDKSVSDESIICSIVNEALTLRDYPYRIQHYNKPKLEEFRKIREIGILTPVLSIHHNYLVMIDITDDTFASFLQYERLNIEGELLYHVHACGTSQKHLRKGLNIILKLALCRMGRDEHAIYVSSIKESAFSKPMMERFGFTFHDESIIINSNGSDYYVNVTGVLYDQEISDKVDALFNHYIIGV